MARRSKKEKAAGREQHRQMKRAKKNKENKERKLSFLQDIGKIESSLSQRPISCGNQSLSNLLVLFSLSIWRALVS